MAKRTFSKGKSKSKTSSPKEKIITDEEMLRNLNAAAEAAKTGIGIRWIN